MCPPSNTITRTVGRVYVLPLSARCWPPRGSRRAPGLLEWDEADLRAPLELLGAVLADESRQRMQSSQALVAGGGATVSVVLQMGQELADQFRR